MNLDRVTIQRLVFRSMNMINGGWHLRHCRFQSVRKAVRRTELSFSLSSVYFGCWFKIIFENGFCRWSLLSRSVSLWIQNYFWPEVPVADRLAPSYRSCFAAVPLLHDHYPRKHQQSRLPRSHPAIMALMLRSRCSYVFRNNLKYPSENAEIKRERYLTKLQWNPWPRTRSWS